ncbi:MAG: hypothetical protein A2W01_10100 [Candidatus Solincola sediminis]|nr:MAG: hypothetical protein A2W01_10100 [Candidatus Solincola sediminis]
MRKFRRILLVLIASGLIISLTMIIPAGAASSSKGDVKVMDAELVYAETDSVGTIEKVQIVDWVSLDGEGTVNVKEKKDLTGNMKFQGVHGFATPKVEGDQIVWGDLTSKGNAQGIASTQLSKEMVEQVKDKIPLDVHYTYTLDGKKVSPEDITGQSGHFKMELTLTNKSKEKSVVEVEDPDTGEMVKTEVETYLPMVIVPYDWYFDNQVFHNLTSDETGITFFFPDFYQVGWSIPLFPPATEASNTIWVEADVTDFRMPVLTLPVAFLFPKTNQRDPLPEFKAGLELLYGGVKQLDEGVGDPATNPSLLYGITKVDQGLQQMADTSAGLPFAKSNLDGQIIPGVEEIAAGMGSTTTPNTLLYGASQSLAGLQSMATGIGNPGQANTLLDGLAQMQAGLQTMQAGIGSAASADTLLNGMELMKEGLEETLAGIGGAATPGTLLYAANAIIGGLQSIRTGVGAAGIQAYINAVIQSFTVDNFPSASPTMNAYVNNNAAYGGTMSAGDISTINAMMSGLNSGALGPAITGLQTIYNNIGDGTNPLTLMYAATAVYGGLDLIRQGIGSASTPDTLLNGIAQVTGGLELMAASIGSASAPGTLLNGIALVTAGVNTMKAGIGNTATANTLINALATMQGGLVQMRAGLQSGSMSSPGINEGLILISEGLGEAVSGLGSASTDNTLLFATSGITGGLTEAKSGTTQMLDGLSENLVMLNTTEAELAAIEQRGKDFDHILGRAEGADTENQVRFLFQSKPTYDYKTGGSMITAVILSIVILLLLIGGALFLVRRATT